MLHLMCKSGAGESLQNALTQDRKYNWESVMYVELIGWLAALLTLIAYSMKTMLLLRIAAVAANLCFISYGSLSGVMPMLALHIVLLPLNSFRLVQILKTTSQVRAASPAQGLPADLVSFLKPISVAPDALLFRRGDLADKIYYLKSGTVLLEEIETHLKAGEIFGEVAFFSDSRKRTLTARCLGKCEIATISEAEFTSLYYQNPEFGFFMLRLLARRLEQNAALITEGAK
jgi:CRP/FNR family transcriptional regulator, cyclic AMP receptor protein